MEVASARPRGGGRGARARVGLGYSNLGEQNVIPLVMAYKDTLVGSLGFEMARHFLELSDKEIDVHSNRIFLNESTAEPIHFPLNISLNYLGSAQRFRSYSFIEILQSYQQNPDSLDFLNKLAFVAVISPGRCSLRPTILTPALPAS